MSKAILPTGYVWLAEAVAITAETRFPEAWAAAQMTEEQSEMLREYRSLRNQYEEQQQCVDRAEPMSLADPGFARWVGGFSAPKEQEGHLPKEPERSAEIELLEEKDILWQNVFDAAWDVLRQALADGKISANCMMYLEPNTAIDAEHWGKPFNNKAHRAQSIFLGLSPSNNRPRSGKAFLLREDVLALVSDLTDQRGRRLLSGDDKTGQSPVGKVDQVAVSAGQRALIKQAIVNAIEKLEGKWRDNGAVPSQKTTIGEFKRLVTDRSSAFYVAGAKPTWAREIWQKKAPDEWKRPGPPVDG